ncbi:MAG: hypothetical protein V3V16_09150 [Melioribacteraceae bacterium]
MKTKLLVLLIFITSSLTFASNHGIYLMTNINVKGNINELQKLIVSKVKSEGYKVLYSNIVNVPDFVRQDKTEHCGFSARLIVLSKNSYSKMLTSYGTKYLVAGFLKIGLYETPNGINVVITDPETINRIVFNDLFENDKVDLYKELISKTKKYKNSLVSLLHNSVDGEKVKTAMEPIRDDEDLEESSKDMFMMVGSLTLFNDEDQFPLIYSTQNSKGFLGIQKLKEKFIANLKSFKPTEDDKEYRWYPNEKALKWKVISEIQLPNKNAILLGLTRPRTEAVSFNIASASREDEGDMCPGIDHVTAYPFEVLILQEENKINVYTQRQMHRMDMYFWDAGMSAFMDHMSMPGILDASLRKALLGKEYIED